MPGRSGWRSGVRRSITTSLENGSVRRIRSAMQRFRVSPTGTRGAEDMNREDRPTRLRIEHGPLPLGVGFERPRLSWWLPAAWEQQSGYEVEATVDGVVQSSGLVASRQSILRPWPFPSLGSRSVVRWRVQVPCEELIGANGQKWTNSRQRCSESAIGTPVSSVWRAMRPRWADGEKGRRSTSSEHSRLRRTSREHAFTRRPTASMSFTSTVTRLGDLELTPGFTAYRSHLEFQTYDVTDLITPGEHILTATVGDGWWRGAVGFTHQECCYGKSLAFLAQIEMIDGHGRRRIDWFGCLVGRDSSWTSGGVGPHGGRTH